MAQASRAAKMLIYERLGNKILGGIKKVRDKIPPLKRRAEEFEKQWAAGTYKKNWVDKVVDRVLD